MALGLDVLPDFVDEPFNPVHACDALAELAHGVGLEAELLTLVAADDQINLAALVLIGDRVCKMLVAQHANVLMRRAISLCQFRNIVELKPDAPAGCEAAQIHRHGEDECRLDLRVGPVTCDLIFSARPRLVCEAPQAFDGIAH